MDSIQLIQTYEAILNTTGKMVKAAQDSDWDNLVTLELECKKLTQQLMDNNIEIELSPELSQKKIQLIHQVLEDDARIRSITEPWMEKLKAILDTTEQKRNLQKIYQPDQSIY